MKRPAALRTTSEPMDRRLLGSYSTGRAGPTILALGGIHGNEPAGIAALNRVVAKLQELELPLHGTLVAIAGNLGALRQDERFIERDLNRRWAATRVAQLRNQPPDDDCAEDSEQRELLEIFDRYENNPEEATVFVDLHSSSANGPPFSCLADTLPNRRLALSIPIPVILGLEECIDGAVMEHFAERGHVAIAIEGGQHSATTTVDNLEAALWLTLVQTGALSRNHVDLEAHRRVLRHAACGLPAVVEIRHRQAITSMDQFRMEPGFRSFDCVHANQLIARDIRGPLLSHEPGRLLLPLYQGQGEDGFFLTRDVAPIWLALATILRQLRFHRLLHWLPGVQRVPGRRDLMIADPRVTRWFVGQVFHLCGFRTRRPRDGKLWFSRRVANSRAWSVRPR